MLVEQYFPIMNRYSVVSDTATPIDAIEWFAKNKGITDLDKPGAKVRTIIDDVNESELARQQAKKTREAIARSAYIDALIKLENGTAVHRQKSGKNEVLKKVRAIKKAKPKVAKPAKQVANKPQAVKAVRAIKPVVRKSAPKHKAGRKIHSSHQAAKIRRTEMLELLKAGTPIPMQPKQAKKGEFDCYQQQKNGLERIEAETGLKILRIRRIKDNQSFYALDNFKRHQIAKKVIGNLNTDDRKDLIRAIASGEMVRVEDIERGAIVGGASMSILSRNHGMNIYSVSSGHYIVGWILIDEAKSEAGKSEINDLGDMLQAIDYLRIKKEVAALMPDATAGEIEEATFIEYKRVQKDGQ